MLLTGLAFLILLTVLLSLAYHAGRASRPDTRPDLPRTPPPTFAIPGLRSGMVRYGTTVENTHVGPHVAGSNIFKGFALHFHQANIGLDLWSDTDPTYPQIKAAADAARDGTDADLDAAGSVAYGSTWWSTHVVSAGRRPQVRLALKHLRTP